MAGGLYLFSFSLFLLRFLLHFVCIPQELNKQTQGNERKRRKTQRHQHQHYHWIQMVHFGSCHPLSAYEVTLAQKKSRQFNAMIYLNYEVIHSPKNDKRKRKKNECFQFVGRSKGMRIWSEQRRVYFYRKQFICMHWIRTSSKYKVLDVCVCVCMFAMMKSTRTTMTTAVIRYVFVCLLLFSTQHYPPKRK